jgi:hypothetical protein
MSDPIRSDVLNAKIEELLQRHQDSEGVIFIGVGSQVEDDLTLFLENKALPRDFRREARVLLDRYDKNHKPRRNPGQPVLFDPEVLYVLGEGDRVRAATAKRKQVILAIIERTKAHSRETEDYQEDMVFFNSRLAKFTSDEETLLEVEKRHFGFGADQEPPQDIAAD